LICQFSKLSNFLWTNARFNASLVLGTFSFTVFVKVQRPLDSEVTFSFFVSSCHLLLPVYQSLYVLYPRTQQANLSAYLHNNAKRQAGKL